MKITIPLQIEDIVPSKDEVLLQQGVPEGKQVPHVINNLADKAVDIFSGCATPVGIMEEISANEFEQVLHGEGQNAEDVLVGRIYPNTEFLAMFALTMGTSVSEKIEELFKVNDFALASLLDAAASIAADKAVSAVEEYYQDMLSKREISASNNFVLSYSPGYCGWNISGQKKLFRYLNPEIIGIFLNNSFLMSPIKSVTALLVAGVKEIHIFENSLSYCRSCKDRTCIERMKKITDV